MYLGGKKMVEEIKGKVFSVLDDGHVILVDVMGEDSSIVQAARVSYGKGTKTVREDRGLIRYLMRRRHTTPFEMAELKFKIRVPMDCWRQWIRHRTASVNEYSTRYSEAIDSMAGTPSGRWRRQNPDNRQGSSGQFLDAEEGARLTAGEKFLQEEARLTYIDRLAAGVAREQARKDLPLSTYTEAYWKIDLHNLLHFLSLRLDPHAQYEIQQYAQVIGYGIVRPLFPITWEAFEDYRLGAQTFSRMELLALSHLIFQGGGNLRELGEGEFGFSQREAAEFIGKLEDLGWEDRE